MNRQQWVTAIGLAIAAVLGAALALAQSATDRMGIISPGLTSPWVNVAAVTPHDTNELSFVSRGFYVTSGGTIAFVTAGGQSITGTVGDDKFYPVRLRKVLATGTTATGIYIGD